MKITVNNWKKYHHRNDVKIMHWFRISADLPMDPKLFDLQAETKWLFICLLSLCAKSKKSELNLTSLYIEHICQFKEVDKHLYLLAEKGIINVAWDGAGPDLVRTRPSTEQDITEQNRTLVPNGTSTELKTSDSAVVKKQAAVKSRFNASSYDEVLSSLSEHTKRRWMALYEDSDWIKRELVKAIGWYFDNPRKKPKSVRGWSMALSSWLERSWSKKAKFEKGKGDADGDAELAEIVKGVMDDSGK